MRIRSGFSARCRLALVAALAAFSLGDAIAHGASVGAVEITHPFATPSLPGASTGAAYFTTLENKGANPDQLVRAATPVAASVEMHTMNIDAQGVMRMREVDAIAIAPHTAIRMRPGAGFHLMLVGLKQPLKEGDTFPLSLQFEHAGKVEVKVVVQTPRASGAMGGMQPH
jgi:periplasmic copper chaperone A